MKKVTSEEDLKVGELYSDKDGVRYLIYHRKGISLYEFVEADIDDNGWVFDSDREVRLTYNEILNLYNV